MEDRELFFMNHALQLAREAGEVGEVPVGAVIVLGGHIIGRGNNSVIRLSDPTAHAEIQALREAAHHVGNYRILDSELFVSLEPCVMCYGAMVHARISKLYYGAADPKTGIFSTGSFEQIKKIFNHTITITQKFGIISETSSRLLQAFFQERRGAGAVERGGLENR